MLRLHEDLDVLFATATRLADSVTRGKSLSRLWRLSRYPISCLTRGDSGSRLASEVRGPVACLCGGRPCLDKRHASSLKKWVRLLTVKLACLPSFPSRVEAHAGRGLHIFLHSHDERLLHLCFTPTAKTPDAAFRSRTSAIRYLGDRQPVGYEKVWMETLFHALGTVDALDGWNEFLAWAAERPSVALPYASGFEEGASSGDELLVRITGRCNASCDFCSARGILPDLVEGERLIHECLVQARKRGKSAVSFTGGEPTLIRRLPFYLRLAGKEGFERLDLQTNGLLLARRDNVERLVDAGLNSIFLSLHSAEAGIHDEMLKVKGAFQKAVKTAELCQAAGIDVGFNNVLTTENLSGVVEYIEFIKHHFNPRSCHVCLSYCAPQGWARDHLELMPRLNQAAPLLSRALQAGRRLGLQVRIPGMCGVPMCVLPDHLEQFDEYHREDPPRLADRTFADGCPDCDFFSRCSGFWRTYLDRHGSGEIGPEAFRGRKP